MGRPLYILVLALLIFSACQKPEEVLPAPPPQSENPPPTPQPEKPSEQPKPSPDAGSELFQYGQFRNLPFRYLVPRGYDSTRQYPLHIFLHGMGERGTDNERQLSAGSANFQQDSVRDNYPAFIIFPQCPESQYWFSREIVHNVKALVDTLTAHLRIDEDQISIGGFSMGAYGTFAIVAEYPKLFEAALVIAGDGEESWAGRMNQSRWHLFAGKKDEIVPSEKTEKMARALENAGAAVAFKLYPEADHARTLERAFSEPDFFSWLFEADTRAKPLTPETN